MTPIERIKLVLEHENLKREELAKITGITYTRWQSVINEKSKLRLEEIEALGMAFPDYKLWLAYGEEMPEAGQISPMTKATMNDLQTQRTAE